MPANSTYVCVTCRIAQKSVGYGGRFSYTPTTCRRCHGDMVSIGKNRRVPKKDDDKGWQKIKEIVDAHRSRSSRRRR